LATGPQSFTQSFNNPQALERIMELSSLFGLFGESWIDEFLIWAVASAAAIVGVVAVVNALNMIFEAEAG
jgi:hypothetical protein